MKTILALALALAAVAAQAQTITCIDHGDGVTTCTVSTKH